MEHDDSETIEYRPITTGDIVQLSPQSRFSCGLMIVTEVKSWGVVGYIHHFGKLDATINGKVVSPCIKPDRYYYRAKFEGIKRIGKAVWADDDIDDGWRKEE